MQYRKKILAWYFIGIILVLGLHKLAIMNIKMPGIFREISTMYGILSVIGIVLAIIPVRRSRVLKWVGIIGNIGIYIWRFQSGIYCNKVLSVILFIIFIFIAMVLYWSYDNVAVLNSEQKSIYRLIQSYETENVIYEQEIERLNELEHYWSQVDEKLGIEKSLKCKLKEKFNISNEIEVNRDIKRKYPPIDCKPIIGIGALFPDSSDLDKIVESLEKYRQWLNKNEEKIRFRANIVRKRISQLESQIIHVEESLHSELDEKLVKEFHLDEFARNIKKKYNEKNKAQSKIKKKI